MVQWAAKIDDSLMKWSSSFCDKTAETTGFMPPKTDNGDANIPDHVKKCISRNMVIYKELYNQRLKPSDC